MEAIKPCKHATRETPVCQRCAKNRERVRLWTVANKERAAARRDAWDKKHPRRALLRKRRSAKRRKHKKAETQRSTRARMRGALVTEPISVEMLWNRDGGICGLCGRAVPMPGTKKHRHNKSPETATVDHKTPLKQGGQHVWENVQLAHMWCNSEKQDRVPSVSAPESDDDHIPF